MNWKIRLTENPFFLNLADLLVGILLIFIIILFFFAINFTIAMEKNAELRRFIIERDEIRKEILDEVASRLRASGLEVEVDGTDGVLRLSDSQLLKP